MSLEKDYFEKLLDAKFHHVHADIKSLKEDTESILSKSTNTLDRVVELEKWRSEREGFNQGVGSAETKVDKTIGFWILIIGIAVGVLATYLWH